MCEESLVVFYLMVFQHELNECDTRRVHRAKGTSKAHEREFAEERERSMSVEREIHHPH